MNKTAGLILATVTISLLAIVTVYSQEDMTHVDNERIKAPSACRQYSTMNSTTRLPESKSAASATTFTKRAKSWKTNLSEDQRCSECHDFKASDNTPGLTKAYHTNCKGCHLQQKKGRSCAANAT